MSNLGRMDVERIVETILAELSLEVRDESSNDKIIILKYKEREISRTKISNTVS